MTVRDPDAMDRAATMFFDGRATSSTMDEEEAPYGSKHDDWHPGETAAYIAAAIDRVLATMDDTRDSVADTKKRGGG